MGTAIYAQVEPGGWSTPQMHVYCVSMVWGQVLAKVWHNCFCAQVWLVFLSTSWKI